MATDRYAPTPSQRGAYLRIVPGNVILVGYQFQQHQDLVRVPADGIVHHDCRYIDRELSQHKSFLSLLSFLSEFIVILPRTKLLSYG
jgi:hypothetical protein